MDEKKSFGPARFSFSALSLRRKIGLLILLLLVGAGLSDPAFLKDADTPDEITADAGGDEFGDLDSLIDTFHEESAGQNVVAEEPLVAAEEDVFDSVDSVGLLQLPMDTALVIPPQGHEGVPVQEASMAREATENSPLPTTVPSTNSDRRPGIRLTGTIYPIH